MMTKMNFKFLLAGALFVAAAGPAPLERNHLPPHGPVAAQVAVCFTPAQHCSEAVVAAIDAAQREIRVQAYGFTSPSILKALANAKKRGVDVQAILDKSNDPVHPSRKSQYTGATFAVHAGIPTWIDYKPAIAHNKVIVIDQKLVIGGSYNYTSSAENRNAENVTFSDSPELARFYLDNWESRKAESRVFDDE